MIRIFAFLLAAFALSAQAQTVACDRDCLRGHVTRYLDALVAHNPGAAALDPKVRMTEDTVEIKAGDGIWKTATRITPYRYDILDVRQAVAVSHVVVEESGKPTLFVVRLKVAAGKITEVEAQVTRSRADGALFNTDTLQTASPALLIVPTAVQRVSREEAIRLANFYPAGLTIGSFVTVDAPFSSDAYRIENGSKMAGPGCTRAGCENIKTQTIMKHPALTSRVVAVDEDLGIVELRMNFGDTGSYGPGNALMVFETFKVYGGQIHAVEAFMKVMPATTPVGW